MGQTESVIFKAKETFKPADLGEGGTKYLSISIGDDLKKLMNPKDKDWPSGVAKEPGNGTLTTETKELRPVMHYCKNCNTKKKGFVFDSLVGLKGTLYAESWFFGCISRAKAESLLNQEFNIAGSFMVRESITRQYKGSYALSIKTKRREGEERGKPGDVFRIKHMEIKNSIILETGKEIVFVASAYTFESLKEMIESYQNTSLNGVHLTNICQRPRPIINEIGGSTGKWEINRGDLEINDVKIGAGNFGSVYSGKWRGQVDVAIKQLVPGDNDEEFYKETENMQNMHHPHLVQVFGVCSKEEPLMMVMEFLEKGDLRKHLHTFGKEMKCDALINICENIASGMQALEAMGIIHRDLAARNVMLDKWGQGKVGDFGLARQQEEYSSKSAKFPVKWTAPESISKKMFTSKSDVWSFGVLLWEIFSLGELPYPGFDNGRTFQEIKRGYRMPMPDVQLQGANKEITDTIYKIMLVCWDKAPEKRPTFETLHNDFFDFDSTRQSKYDYGPSEYMISNGYTMDPVVKRAKGGNARRGKPRTQQR